MRAVERLPNREYAMTCNGCGNEEARRIRRDASGERCDKCGNLSSLKREKKGGFMFQGKSLHKNSNKNLASQVRQEYLGTSHDEVRGKDF